MTTAPPPPDAALLDSLADRVEADVAAALGGARAVALVNFPNHNNPGDSAIWLGARAVLARLGVRVAYQCAWDTYNPGALARNLPAGAPILINGGGNFGDLYRGQQGLRERILATQRDRPIVQLPQSILFRDPANVDRNRRLIDRHGAVTLLLREERSYAFAGENFPGARTVLSPDIALGLRRLPRPLDAAGGPGKKAGVLFLHRLPKDPEYVDHGFETIYDVSDREWLRGQGADEPAWSVPHRIALRANRFLRARAARQPRWAHRAWRPLGWTFAPVGRGYVRRGLRLMDTHRLLVTDKLHGHLMATLAGIDHIVLDNSYGKVSGVYRAWTSPATVAHWAENGPAAAALVAELLGGG